MTGIIKINETYGTRIGNLQVFTYEEAARAYKIFCGIFNRDMSLAASIVLDNAAKDMHQLGFLREEIGCAQVFENNNIRKIGYSKGVINCKRLLNQNKYKRATA